MENTDALRTHGVSIENAILNWEIVEDSFFDVKKISKEEVINRIARKIPCCMEF